MRQSATALGHSVSDVRTDELDAEYKHRAALPKWLVDAAKQAVANARDGRIPLLVLHEKGRRHDNDLVVMRLKDFEDFFGAIRKEDVEASDD